MLKTLKHMQLASRKKLAMKFNIWWLWNEAIAFELGISILKSEFKKWLFKIWVFKKNIDLFF